MMHLQERQCSSALLLNEWIELSNCETSIQHAVVSVVFTKDHNGDWRYLLGHCELVSNGSLDSVEVVYPSFSFVKREILNFSLSGFLAALEGEGFIISENFPPLKKADSSQINWMRGLIPSHATKSEFPVLKYSVRLGSELSFYESPLIGFDLPYVDSVSQHIKNFLELEHFHGNSDGQKGEFSIKINNYSARINFDGQFLSFDANVYAHLVGKNSSSQLINLSEKQQLHMTVQDLSDSEIFLINRNNEILDYRSRSHWKYRLESGADKTTSRKLLALIEAGESQYLEFKKYIEVTKNRNQKSEELEKTVCAFSNAYGGQLLIGVNDEGNVDGVNDFLVQHYNCAIEEAVPLYVKGINKRLSENLKNNQCYDISHLVIGDKYIIVVDVERSEELNYGVTQEWAYVRVGATSRKMRSAESRPENRKLPLEF